MLFILQDSPFRYIPFTFFAKNLSQKNRGVLLMKGFFWNELQAVGNGLRKVYNIVWGSYGFMLKLNLCIALGLLPIACLVGTAPGWLFLLELAVVGSWFLWHRYKKFVASSGSSDSDGGSDTP